MNSPLSAFTPDDNAANLAGWLVVGAAYCIAFVGIVGVLLWARRRNRMIREHLDRIEAKLDGLLARRSGS